MYFRMSRLLGFYPRSVFQLLATVNTKDYAFEPTKSKGWALESGIDHIPLERVSKGRRQS
jgi:hypothetical protein